MFRHTSALAVVDIYHCRRTFCCGFVPPDAFQPSQLDRAGHWALPPDPSKLLCLPGLIAKMSVMGALLWVLVTVNTVASCPGAFNTFVSVWLGPQLVFHANILFGGTSLSYCSPFVQRKNQKCLGLPLISLQLLGNV